MRTKDLETLRHFTALNRSTGGSRSPHTDSQVKSEPSEVKIAPKYDETLLAVIGIISTLKDESNVANWIRTGGLHVKAPPPTSSSVEKLQQDPENDTSLTDLAGAISSIDISMSQPRASAMWFEHVDVVDIWASRGRRVLETLDIDITSGIKA